jgi:hypothetical protein
MSYLNASSVGLVYASDAQNALQLQTNSTTAISIDTLQNITISSSTASTNSAQGALTVAGGVGVGGNLNIAGNLTTSGNITAGTITQNGQPVNTTMLLYALAL